MAELESRQAQLEAELRNLQSYLQSDSPQVIAARNALDALKTQVAREKSKLVSPDDDKLNRKTAQFQELRAYAEFRTDLYKLALTALEKAKVASAHKLKSLAVISAPQLPEEAEYPASSTCWARCCCFAACCTAPCA
ncbi:Capsule polysaccharide export protein [Chromobacterium violaceum]|uniref:Capsule polysaccharide export protein n=1 Tax=Chromobacterium violaceum TaxID=536 RepID=A0A447T651_CHRVL|nr:Capsule polysaccharide export protein [Chromobacterium violaceum]